jgi:hypothetical protein
MPSVNDYAGKELEGGFIPIRPKLWRGVLWTRADKKVVWTCKHNHSRPEFNARYSDDPEQVWEMSALNCGRAAYQQFLKGKKVAGDNGMIGDPDWPVELRDDVRRASVESYQYQGRIRLDSSGERVLTVASLTDHWSGNIYLNRSKDRVAPPAAPMDELKRWTTAAWALQSAVWGVVFQDPRVHFHFDVPVQRAWDELFPEKEPREKKTIRKKSTPKKVKPHVRQALNEKGRRVFEVVNVDGDVVKTFAHRGRAAAELEKLS